MNNFLLQSGCRNLLKTAFIIKAIFKQFAYVYKGQKFPNVLALEIYNPLLFWLFTVC